MTRYASRLLGSVFALGLAVACGDDGRVFDQPSEPDGGRDVSRGDAGVELATDDVASEVSGSTATDGGSEQQPDGGTTRAADTSAVTATTGDPMSSGTATMGGETIPDSGTTGAETSGADSSTDVTSEHTSEADTTEPSVVVTVEAEGDDEWVGFSATLTASASASDGSTVTYSWALISKPAASQASNGDIVASGDTASLYLDFAGEYVLRVAAATEAGEQATYDVTVRGRAYDVGYLNVAGDQDSSTYAGFMVKSDGTSARQVGCYFQNTATSESAWLSEFQQQGKLTLLPYLPNDGATSARIAYSQPSTTSAYQMVIAGPDNDCDGNQPPQVVGGLFPTFSPNGQRVAVITQERVPDPANEGQTLSVSNIVTYNVDGTDARLLRADFGGGTSGVSWVDDETLTWIEPAGDASTRAYRVKDIAGAFENDLLAEVTLDCAGAANPIPAGINHAVERGGALFVASTYTAIFSGTSAYSIWRLLPTAGGTYDCNQEAPTNTKVAGDNAHDFDVSLDGTRLLYFSTVDATETETSSSLLFLRDLVNMNEPTALSAEPSTIASGAHFSAGGRQLVWTETKQTNVTVGETTYERPAQSRVIVANADGTNKRVLVTVASSGSQARMLHTGGNSYCSVGFVGAPGFVGVGGLSSLIALGSVVLRRRRRR